LALAGKLESNTETLNYNAPKKKDLLTIAAYFCCMFLYVHVLPLVADLRELPTWNVTPPIVGNNRFLLFMGPALGEWSV